MKTKYLSIFLLAVVWGCNGRIEESSGASGGPGGGAAAGQPPTAAPSPGQVAQAKPHTEGYEVGSFTAEYYDGDRFVATETVDRPTVNYPWSDLHGIKSENFRGVWKGTLEVTGPTQTIDFNADYGRSEGKLFIDDVSLPFPQLGSVTRTLTVGTHSIRVEMDNDWHTTNFAMSFTSNPRYRTEEARTRIQPTLSAETKIVEVEINGTDDFYNNVVVALDGAKTPVFIVLSSNHAIKWVIDNPTGVEIRGVAYGADTVGPTVVVAKGTPTYEIVRSLGHLLGSDRSAAVTGRTADVRREDNNPSSVRIPSL